MCKNIRNEQKAYAWRKKSKLWNFFRHTRAMHLYRNGMSLQLLSEFMGHASLVSTQIYAYVDTEMKRQAIEKTRQVMVEEAPLTQPAWQTDEELVKKLYDLEYVDYYSTTDKYIRSMTHSNAHQSVFTKENDRYQWLVLEQ